MTETAPGIWKSRLASPLLSGAPASTRITLAPLSARRRATAQPALPAPTTM